MLRVLCFFFFCVGCMGGPFIQCSSSSFLPSRFSVRGSVPKSLDYVAYTVQYSAPAPPYTLSASRFIYVWYIYIVVYRKKYLRSNSLGSTVLYRSGYLSKSDAYTNIVYIGHKGTQCSIRVHAIENRENLEY